jgi:hypothetical protein
MHVDLPSGASVEIRDRVTSGQRKKYYEAIEVAREVEADVPIVIFQPDGKPQRDADGTIVTAKDEQGRTLTERKLIIPIAASMDTRDVFMGMLVTSWTLDLPLPATAPVNADGTPRNVFDDLDIEDYDTLSEAVEPLVEKLRPSFKPTPDESSPTGPSGE